MRNIILGLSVVLLSINATAQDETSAQLKRHEFAAGYGMVGTSAVISVFSDVLATAITGGSYSKTNNKWSGNFVASYKFSPSPKLSIGLTYAHTKNSAEINYNNVPSGKSIVNYHTIAGELQYNYISKPFFRLYGIVGLGYTNYTEKYEPTAGTSEKNSAGHFNFQVSPIGFKLGNTVGIYGEVGFGYKGLFNGGLYVRL